MKILVPTQRGLRVEVDADPVGDWASHRAIESDRAWTVTHVPSGLRIPRYYPRVEASRLAERLAVDVPTIDGLETHWTGQPTMADMGPGYLEHLDKMRAIVAEFMPVEDMDP